jgi:hypothetical protein
MASQAAAATLAKGVLATVFITRRLRADAVTKMTRSCCGASGHLGVSEQQHHVTPWSTETINCRKPAATEPTRRKRRYRPFITTKTATGVASKFHSRVSAVLKRRLRCVQVGDVNWCHHVTPTTTQVALVRTVGFSKQDAAATPTTKTVQTVAHNAQMRE